MSLSQIDSNVRSMGIVSQQFSQSCIHCTKNDSMQGCANWFGGFNDGLIYIIYGTFPLQTKKRRIWSTRMTWPFEYVIFKSWSQDEPFWFPVTFKHFWGVRQLAPPTIRLCNYEEFRRLDLLKIGSYMLLWGKSCNKHPCWCSAPLKSGNPTVI